MLKYALRYAPLLVLALFLIPWRIYTEGNVGQFLPSRSQVSSLSGSGSALQSVAILSPNDVWSVGGSFATQCNAQTKTGCSATPVSGTILHYSNNAWAVAGSAAQPLLSISLDSPSDGWAVGYTGTFVHYDGHAWAMLAGPAHFNQSLFGVAMLSPSNGWAVGNSGSILHYAGRQWTLVSSPVSLDLRAIAMPSPQEGWAVGVNGTILHYQNGAWGVAHSPTRNTLNSVSMLSTTEGWAVGEQGTILHYRAEDGSWESVYRNPSFNQSVNLYGVAMNSVRSGWIVGEQQFLTYSEEVWLPANVPINATSSNAQTSGKSLDSLNLYAIAMSRGGEGWAVGSTNSSGLNTIVILHYAGGTWSVSLTMG
jgi:photosystem II stability/assembly factor-like uncharacterized protein